MAQFVIYLLINMMRYLRRGYIWRETLYGQGNRADEWQNPGLSVENILKNKDKDFDTYYIGVAMMS